MMERIRAILERAVWSPSGDNCQPWRFRWLGDALAIGHDAERARHTLNPLNQASHVALGALLESIAVVSTTFGLEARATLGALTDPDGLWARVVFTDTAFGPDLLADAVPLRATDRRCYDCGDANVVSEAARLGVHGVDEVATAVITPSPALRERIARAESSVVALRRALQDTAAWVRFTPAEARLSGDGMPAVNLGLARHEASLFRLAARHEWLRRALLPMMRAQMRGVVRAQIASSAGLVCFGARDARPESFVAVGRVAMRTWLALTARGYGAQPLTLSGMGPQWAEHGLVPDLASARIDAALAWIGRALRGALPAGFMPLWMLRTGVSTPLPANLRTFRRPIVIDRA